MDNTTVHTGNREFHPVESCVDYQAYVYHIDPNIPASHYALICQHLTKLGQTEKERMGVVYVRAPWGFCIIPRHGFPDLRLNFFNEIPISTIRDVMQSISSAFETSTVTIKPGVMNV